MKNAYHAQLDILEPSGWCWCGQKNAHTHGTGWIVIIGDDAFDAIKKYEQKNGKKVVEIFNLDIVHHK